MGNRIRDRILGGKQDLTQSEPVNTTGSAKKFAERYGIMPTSTAMAGAPPGGDEAAFNSIYDTASKLKDPETMQEVFENINELPSSIPEDRQRYYREQQSKFNQLTNEIRKEWKQNRQANNWAQIGELVGQAITQFAAAKEGMRTGVDLSTGLKFKPSDWTARQAQLLKEVQSELDTVKDQQARVTKEQTAEEGRFSKERSRAADAMIRKMFEEIAAGRRVAGEERAEGRRRDAEGRRDRKALLKEATKWVDSHSKKLEENRGKQAKAVAVLKALDPESDSFGTKAATEVGKLMERAVITEGEGQNILDMLNEDAERYVPDVIDYLENKKSSIESKIDPRDRQAIIANYAGDWPAEEVPEEIKQIWRFKYNYEAR